VTKSIVSPISGLSICAMPATTPLRSRHARLEHLLAAEREELLGEGRRAIRRLPDQLEIAPSGIVGRQPEQQELRAAGDDRQEVVEVVRPRRRQARPTASIFWT